jgi:hypothetical protein
VFPHAEVVDVDVDPFSVEYRQENLGGDRHAGSAVDQAFWVATATGPGTQTLAWDLEPRQVGARRDERRRQRRRDRRRECRRSDRLPPPDRPGLGAIAVVLLAVGVTLIVGRRPRPRLTDRTGDRVLAC